MGTTITVHVTRMWWVWGLSAFAVIVTSLASVGIVPMAAGWFAFLAAFAASALYVRIGLESAVRRIVITELAAYEHERHLKLAGRRG